MLKIMDARISNFKQFVELIPEMFPSFLENKTDNGNAQDESITFIYQANVEYICEHNDSLLVKSALEFRSKINAFVNIKTYGNRNKKPSRRELVIFQLFTFYLLAKQRFLDSNYCMEMAAKDLGVNKNFLSGAINKCTGYSFIVIINHYRIAYAKYLISKDLLNKVSFEEIAFNTGFNNRTTFYRVFIDVTGQMPSEFRQQFSGEVFRY